MLSNKGLFVVADGVGGGPAGDMASRCVVDAMCELLADTEVTHDAISTALRTANQQIREVAEKLDYTGMASTVVLAWIQESILRCYHVGDSRIYRFRDGSVEQLTRDHTRAVQRANGAMKFVVTQAMGVKEEIFPDVSEHVWEQGDVLLLMSDGISDHVPDKEMVKLLAGNRMTMADRAHSLIQYSEQQGGTDDKTIIIVFN